MPNRSHNRSNNDMRPVHIEPGYLKNANGSALISMGDTQVLCAATIEDNVPRWLRGQGSGWITAEYGMLPQSTNTRGNREAVRGKQSGRTQEIQRLIGRSLRNAIDMTSLGERTIIIDCDVLQADGGTRTASITGAWVALAIALESLFPKENSPLHSQVAAISVGLSSNQIFLDLDYREDSSADVDFNLVMLSNGHLVEVQGTAESKPFEIEQMNNMIALASKGISDLFKIQRESIIGWQNGK
ncbi:MAG: ribonuclease PH [Chloroflexi bacterium]|nr:ribonuclease PH [Chloroflexota bacterium]